MVVIYSSRVFWDKIEIFTKVSPGSHPGPTAFLATTFRRLQLEFANDEKYPHLGTDQYAYGDLAGCDMNIIASADNQLFAGRCISPDDLIVILLMLVVSDYIVLCFYTSHDIHAR